MPQVQVGVSTYNMPSTSVINPGSVFQSYNSSTGQTTYPNAPSGMASLGSTLANGTQAPGVATPVGTPAGASVYQSNGLYAPSSVQTNFASDPLTGMGLQSAYSQNPSLYPNIKAVPGSISDSDIKKTDKLPEAIAKSQEQLNQIQPGTKIPNVEGLKGLSEKDIARTTSGDVFRRDLAAEQKALGAYIAKNGQPTTATDWLKFHDAVYKGAQVPGATDLPATQQPAAPEIAADDGTIDLQKYETALLGSLKTYNDAITQAQTNLAQFQTDTAKGVANIGDQLGRSATLVQGEQYSLKQQRQADESLLTARLGIAQDAKSYAVESANIQMQIEQKIYDRKRDIVNDARLLRQDQQDSFASFISLASQSGIAKESFTPELLAMINKQSQATGIPSQLYINALDSIYNDKLAANVKGEVPTLKEINGETYQWNPQTNSWDKFTSSDTANLLTPGTIGGQCGDYLHKVADNIPSLGDLFEDKMNKSNVSTNQYKVGDVLIQKTNMPYGHVSIVTAVNGNQATVTESNYGLDEKVGTRTITMGDKSVNGVYRGAQLKNLDTADSGVDTRVSSLAKLVSDKQLTSAQALDQIKGKNDSETDNLKSSLISQLASNGSMSKLDAEATAKLNDKVAQIDDLIAKVDTAGKGVIGPKWFSRLGLLSGNKLTGKQQEFVGSVKQLIQKETLDTLINLKKAGGTLGALSDSEGAMLRQTASKIGSWEIMDNNGVGKGIYNISQSAFKKELQTIKDLTQRAIKNASGGTGIISVDPLGLEVNNDPLGLGI